MISFWSVLSATLWFVLAFLLLFALRGHTNFLMRHGVTAWSIAVILTIVRLLLPLDSERMIVLRSYKLLPMVRRALDYQPVAGVSVSLLLKGLWLVGGLCGIGCVVGKIVRDNRQLRRFPAVSPSPQACSAACQCGINTDMIRMSATVAVPSVIGLLHPTIYVPEDPYNEADLVWAMKHEMNHIAGHDSWLRLGFMIFRCVFWWNPLVHLARKPVDDILELRCDRAVFSHLNEAERVAYAEVLYRIGKQSKRPVPHFICASNFVSPERANALVLRAQVAMENPPRWDKTAVAAFVLSLVLFAASYVFILQPAGMPPATDDSDSVGALSSETAYLKALPSGEYELWCDGELFWSISADELNDPLYQNLEVLP